jgi:hypothetical protein
MSSSVPATGEAYNVQIFATAKRASRWIFMVWSGEFLDTISLNPLPFLDSPDSINSWKLLLARFGAWD